MSYFIKSTLKSVLCYIASIKANSFYTVMFQLFLYSYVSTISELRSQKDWEIFTGMGLVEKGGGVVFFVH